MIKQDAAGEGMKCFKPRGELIAYMRDRLKLSRQMEEKITAEEEFSADMNTQDKSLRTKKTRILNEIVFPAMADLVFFFEAIASHEDLQVPI